MSYAPKSFYATAPPPPPPPPPLRVWARTPGRADAQFEASDASIEQAIAEVRRQGWQRAVVVIQ